MNIPAAFATALQRQRSGQWAEAETSYREILAADPGQAAVHYNLGLVLRSQGRLTEASTSYARALELQPRFPEAANNRGIVLEHLGQLDEAEAAFRQVLHWNPEAADAWSNLAGVLKNLGRVDEAVACLDRAICLQPGEARWQSNRIFTLQYGAADDPALSGQAALAWGRQFGTPLAVRAPSFRNDRSTGRRLRVGYVSPNFRHHCQAFFTRPLFRHHARDQFEIVAYSDAAAPDEVTAALQADTDGWRDTGRLDDAGLAELVRKDRIDILVDLTLHMAGDRLLTFARRPAPVQVTWLGYPGTTGLGAVDYRLTDPWLDPMGSEENFSSERPVRLPGSFWCYDPLTAEPTVNSLPARTAGMITFGCLNNFCKVNDRTLALWAEVLRAVPGSRLLLLAPPGSARLRVQTALGSVAARVEFVPYQPRADYLRLYHQVDLCLDTFPYNGHTTSLDAFWMGVPVVTLVGRSVVARAGLSLAENLGLPGLATYSPAEFVAVAAALARDQDRLAELRGGLRARMARSPLMDAARFACDVEVAYRSMWRTWCETPLA